MIVGIDLGKTSARLRCAHGAGTELRRQGCPGLAEAGAADAVVARVSDLLTEAGGGHVERLVLGVPGAEAAPHVAGEVARRLAGLPQVAQAYVVADSVTAHAGALRGCPGAVLSAGTGAVALAIDAEGGFHQRDGWGQWLGDDGSGAWIGRAGLRQALLRAEGRGGSTTLLSVAEQMFGAAAQIPGEVASSGNPGGELARFTPAVIEAARAGDSLAVAILEEAGVLLAATLAAAAEAGRSLRVAVVGGLARVPEIREPLLARLSAYETETDPGTGLDGAVLLADGDDHPHLVRAHRGGVS